MNTYTQKFKLWSKSKRGSVIIASILTCLISIIIFIPIIFSVKDATGDITAYNRDGNSGTRESFDELILEKEDYERFSENVIEVDGSASMETRIENDDNGIGYVSASQVINYNNSPSDGLPEEMEYYNDNLIVLSFEGIFPSKDNIELGIELGYQASKKFNMFFRVDECEIDNWKFYPNPNNHPISPSYWSFPLPNDGGCDYSSGRSAEDNLSFIAGFAFFNYLLYSEEVIELLPLSISTGEVDFNLAIDDLIVQLDNKGYDYNQNINVYTNGSTSVVESVSKAFNNNGDETDENSFKYITNSSGMDIELVKGHEGSSDAFNNPDSDPVPISIGFQSRKPNINDGESEFEDWGYDAIDETYGGAYYFGFETDAIAIVVNANNPIYSENGQNISREHMRLIYLYGTGIDWEDIYFE